VTAMAGFRPVENAVGERGSPPLAAGTFN